MKSRKKKKTGSLKKRIRAIIFLFIILGLGFLYLNMKYPIGYNSTIKKYAKQYDLDPYLIASIINVESSYNKEAISPKSARGLMQIGPQTGQWASEEIGIEDYSEDKLFDPEINIMIGSWYLDRLKSEFDDNLDHVLIAYNAGSGNLKKWLENEEYCKDGENLINIPFEETRNYLIKVKRNYKIYSTVYKSYFNKLEEDNLYVDLANNMRNVIKGFVK